MMRNTVYTALIGLFVSCSVAIADTPDKEAAAVAAAEQWLSAGRSGTICRKLEGSRGVLQECSESDAVGANGASGT